MGLQFKVSHSSPNTLISTAPQVFTINCSVSGQSKVLVVELYSFPVYASYVKYGILPPTVQEVPLSVPSELVSSTCMVLLEECMMHRVKNNFLESWPCGQPFLDLIGHPT